MSRDDRLSPRQQTAVVMLASGHSIKQTSGMTRVSARTIHRWMSGSTPFMAELKRLRAEKFQIAADAMAGLQLKAVNELKKLLNTQKESVRLGAIRTTFEHATALRQITSIEERLIELERRAGVGE